MTHTQLQAVGRAFKAPNPRQGPLILERFTERLDEGLTAPHYPGLEFAIIGTIEIPHEGEVLCYSRERIVAIFMERDGMSRLDAEDYVDFNIVNSTLGARTPVLLS